jgi:uncharacterized sulfatase
MYPSSHGVFSYNDKLSSDAVTVPDVLSSAGFKSIYIGKNSQVTSAIDATNRFVKTVSISRRNVHKAAGIPGLMKYLFQIRSHSGGFTTDMTRHKGGYLTNEAVKRQINSHSEPVFMYVHYNDSHNPYIPPLPYLKEAVADLPISMEESVETAKRIFDKEGDKYKLLDRDEDLTDTELEVITSFYTATIRYIDKLIYSIIDYILSELNAVVIVTGDHGELFGEDNLIGHVISTHNAVTHVPLIVQGDTELTNYDGQIQHIDVMKTLLAEMDLNHSQFQGFDLRNQSREYSIVERGEHRSDTTLKRIEDINGKSATAGHHKGHLISIQTNEFKFKKSKSKEELFRLPNESKDVKNNHPEVLEKFRTKYESFVEEYGGGGTMSEESDMTEQTKQRLRDMGYLVD